jgi:hypothetical protein
MAGRVSIVAPVYTTDDTNAGPDDEDSEQE